MRRARNILALIEFILLYFSMHIIISGGFTSIPLLESEGTPFDSALPFAAGTSSRTSKADP